MNAAAPAATPTVALALSGGGARGLAHIHVIEALDEMGIRPVAVAGSSIGAILGAGVAAGMRGDDIRAFATSILGRRAEVASRVWRTRPGSLAQMMQGGLRLTQFDIERVLTVFLPDRIPADFAALQIPLQVTATDYFGHHVTVMAEGDLHSALAASAAIPAVFRPVKRDGRVYIDGGIYNPLPFDLVRGLADIVVAVDVVGAPEEGARGPTSIDLMFGATQLMMQSIIAGNLIHSRPDILVRPPVSRFRVLDFLKIEQVLAETASVKDEVKRALEAELRKRAAP
jgi:NTE family protein